MIIRRFRNSGQGPNWRRLAYVEYRDDLLFEEGRDGSFGRSAAWTLADAERLVVEELWVEIKTMVTQQIGDWPEDFEHENGGYFRRCVICSDSFLGHKRRVLCKVCHRENKKAEPDLPDHAVAASEVRTMRSMDLYKHFQEFRYAQVTTAGLGGSYNRAVEYIDEQVRIRVAEILKGLK